MKRIYVDLGKILMRSGDDSANTFIYYVALSFFFLIPFALVGAFNNVSFLVSFAISGLFFTLYDKFTKKRGEMLFLGILFAITVPQILQMKSVNNVIVWLLSMLNKYLGVEISSTSISNALTIASLSLVLFSLSRKNQEMKEIKDENDRLNDTIDQQVNWATKFEQIDQLDDVDEQIRLLTEIIENENDLSILSRSYTMRGNAYKTINTEQAIVDFNFAIKLKPDYAPAYFYRGQFFKNIGKHEEALKDYTKVIDLSPDNEIAYNSRAILLGIMGKQEEALDDYTKAIELNSSYPKAYYNRAKLLNEMSKHEDALYNYNKAIELNPSYSKAYNNRAILLREMGRQEEALEDYTKVLDLEPDYSLAYNNRANLLREMGKQEEAIEDYIKAIELNPTYAIAYNNYANLLRDIGKMEDALSSYEKAIELNPNYAKAHYNRAKLLQYMEKQEELNDDVKEIELNPDYDTDNQS
jgi:tetratricopeptide (TPR) repeat protein